MGLHVWRSGRADGLIEPLAQLLAEPPADPFTREVIAVPTAGIERWLSQELALRLGTAAATGTDGVCANVCFPFPGEVIATALDAAGGLPDDADVWGPDRLVWPLLAMAGDDPDAPWWGPARFHLASPGDGRRFSAARSLVDLFDRYAVHRPEMVLAWRAGDDVGPDLAAIPASHAWQPQLWRRIRAHVGTPSTAERFGEAAATLESGDVDLDLPERLSVFGLTALPESYLRVLTAVASTRDVHLFLLHPSPVLWDRVAALAEPPRTLARGPRDGDLTAELPRNPLLGSWGRDAREMQVVFTAIGAPAAEHHPLVEPEPTSLLARIQADVRADRAPDGASVAGTLDLRPILDPSDRSLQVHACHGRMRQVQVLRDAILHLLATHDDLEPRDIIVMCPDVETFAPLVSAVFGAEVDTTQGDGAPSLRVRLADRSLRQTNPVLRVVAELLDLADARLTGPEVVDLLGREPVRRRFRLDDDDLERIESWVADVGVRWGLDGDDRARYDLPGLEANTWRFGLDRLLAGIAMADEDLRLLADTVPYDDVEGSDVELAGRFAECLDRLKAVCTDLRAPRSIAAWRDAIAAAADRLTATRDADAWTRQQLNRILDEFVDHATAGIDPDADGPSTGEGRVADHPTALTLAEVRGLLADRLRGRPTRANHRTGDLTVSTLVPMRAVPHRVVCLLGMDDGSFPRRTVGDGDDLVDLVPFVGDRDARTEDRQLLLDALLAATEHLVVIYSGRDERTNEPLPPAVPIGELLDVADATVRVDPTDDEAADGDAAPMRARDRITTAHPLQPFDARNYVAGELGSDGPWSFDTVGLAGAAARRDGLVDPPPFITEALPPRPEDTDVVDLASLIRFLQHPAKAFLSERLGVWFSGDADTLDDGIPVDLDGLQRWQVGDRLLSARLGGHGSDAWERVERARGTLPPGPGSQAVIDEVAPIVDDLLTATDDLIGDLTARSIELDLPLPDGRRLLGTVTDVCGDKVAAVSYSSLKSKARLAAYARLVAVTLHDPDTPWTAVLVHRLSKTKKNVEWCRLGPLGDDPAERRTAATHALATLVDLYDRGMRLPAPLYGDTSESIARQVAAGKNVWKASDTWETSWPPYPQGDLDPCHVAVLGRVATFSELLEDPPASDEVGDEWPECEERIVAWARRLWDPILTIEDGGKR